MVERQSWAAVAEVAAHLACSGPCPLVVEGHDRRAARMPLFVWHQSLHLRRWHQSHDEKAQWQRQLRHCPSCHLRYYGSSGHPSPRRRHRHGPSQRQRSGRDGLVESARHHRHRAWRTCGGRDGRCASANWRSWRRPRDGNRIEWGIHSRVYLRNSYHRIEWASIIEYIHNSNETRRDLTDGAATGAGDGAEESGSLIPLAASESAGQWLASMTAGPLGEGCFQAERLAGEADGEGDGDGAWSCGVGSGEEESAAAGGSIADWLGFGWGLGWIATSFGGGGGDPSRGMRCEGEGDAGCACLPLLRLRCEYQPEPDAAPLFSFSLSPYFYSTDLRSPAHSSNRPTDQHLSPL